MNGWPTVSAIVNTCNRPHLLPRALDSILTQGFTDYELIVVHDGPPSPETLQVLETYVPKFEERDIEVVVIATEECSGYQCAPKNVGAQHARGDYLAYLDDDNEWSSDHLEVLVRAIEEGDRWPDFVYGRRSYVDDRSPEAKAARTLYEGVRPLIVWNEESKVLLQSPLTNFIDTSDTLIARGAMWRLELATGMMWNEGKRRFGDWELFARGVYFAGWRGKEVDSIVQTYHWHGENLQIVRPIYETPVRIDAHGVPYARKGYDS